MTKKQLGVFMIWLAFVFLITGCVKDGNGYSLMPSVSMEPSSMPVSSLKPSSDPESSSKRKDEMKIELTADSYTIVFRLNNSSASKSLYHQLPLTLPIENYSVNEKIFYPPEELDVSDTPFAEGPAGTLAYYEPWGDVAIFYGECGGADGLFELGEAISGIDQIEDLTGEIRIEKYLEGDSDELNSNSSIQSEEQASRESVQPSSVVPASGSIFERLEGERKEGDKGENVRKEAVMQINVKVGDSAFTATLENNAVADAFAEMMENAPIIIQMSDYSGFEKVGSFDNSLPVNDSQITAQPGDIVLYHGNQIVLFYGSNAWSYTRLGKIDDLSGWEEALGDGDVTVSFSRG